MTCSFSPYFGIIKLGYFSGQLVREKLCCYFHHCNILIKSSSVLSSLPLSNPPTGNISFIENLYTSFLSRSVMNNDFLFPL